ncbi:HNH endonuclease signature motif containing protein [Thalassococcus profundi]|nr:HNH endonuclease signature motif containing protein [Thalassococcus profundi]
MTTQYRSAPLTADPANGMILRADIHRLFDAGLLSIDGAGSVSVSADVTDAEFRRFHEGVAATGADLANLQARPSVIGGA